MGPIAGQQAEHKFILQVLDIEWKPSMRLHGKACFCLKVTSFKNEKSVQRVFSRKRAEYGFREYGFKHRAQWVFRGSLSSRERAQWVSFSQFFVCKRELTEFFAELTEFAPKLSEAQWVLFSETVLSKQYSAWFLFSRGSTLSGRGVFFVCLSVNVWALLLGKDNATSCSEQFVLKVSVTRGLKQQKKG